MALCKATSELLREAQKQNKNNCNERSRGRLEFILSQERISPSTKPMALNYLLKVYRQRVIHPGTRVAEKSRQLCLQLHRKILTFFATRVPSKKELNQCIITFEISKADMLKAIALL